MSTATQSRPTKRPLGEVAKFLRGITFKPDDVVDPGTDDSVVCMRTKNIQADLDQSDLIAVPRQFVKRDELYLRESDILVSTANSWNLVGKCSWVPRLDYDATAGGFISILRADATTLFPRYLYHWFNSDAVQHAVRQCGRQTTNISNMSFEQCEALEIPLPPLPEQKRIADILDKADAIRRKRREATNQLESLSVATYFDWFGHPTSSKDSKPLGECVTIVSGGTPSKQNSSYWGGDFPWVSPKDMKVDYIADAEDHVTDLAFKDTSLKKLPTRSILIVVRGMILAHTVPIALTDVPVAINQDMKALLPASGYLPDFLCWTLKAAHNYILSKVATAAHGTKRLEVEHLMGVPVPNISPEHQGKFADVVGRIRLARHKSTAFESAELFNSLVQRAFRGEL